MEGLFEYAEAGEPSGPGHQAGSPAPGGGALAGNAHDSAPLAVRMRPRTLDELAGQRQLLAAGSPLRRLVEGDQPMSLLLWGPPGTGKTTIASIVSRRTGRHFVEVSAVAAGVKEVRAAIDAARSRLAREGRETVLFVDEVHRFTKAQQDALLPGVENRWVTLVAATTENPFFSVISPLLSRSLLLTLEPLTDDDIRDVIGAALTEERGLGGTVELDPDAFDHLVRLAGGDARRALTYLEAAAGAATATGATTVDLTTAETAVDRAAVRYDRQGDQHYDVISAFIKSIRGSDVDAALHYLARMVEAGEDPRFIARRLVILASEDIGLADPTALTTAVAAAQAVQLIGMPEGRLNLAQAVIALAVAPKSNSVIRAIEAASADVRAGKIGSVPAHLRDAHYAGSKKLGHGKAYVYAHDAPFGVAEQQYAPDVVADAEYYQPTALGAEAAVKQRWERLRRIIRGAGASDDTTSNPSDAPG
ncbi:MAG: putative ATPase [Nocardioidaceae bacterium]|nr:putative ATPase [Nocardioidaceae bacterium]